MVMNRCQPMNTHTNAMQFMYDRINVCLFVSILNDFVGDYLLIVIFLSKVPSAIFWKQKQRHFQKCTTILDNMPIEKDLIRFIPAYKHTHTQISFDISGKLYTNMYKVSSSLAMVSFCFVIVFLWMGFVSCISTPLSIHRIFEIVSTLFVLFDHSLTLSFYQTNINHFPDIKQ